MCEQIPIAAYIDGDLSGVEQREVERHLDGCAACRSLVADLRTIHAAAFTLDRRVPAGATLPAIQARIAAEPPITAPSRLLAFRASPRASMLWLGAAAALVVATFVGLAPLVGESRPPVGNAAAVGPDDEALVDSVESDLKAAEAHYDKAIQGLEQIARSDNTVLEPGVAAVLQKNLQVIDVAIGESRTALQTQPTSIDARDSLFENMRSKVALLQQTVELINEMRKGNQAEAGRLIQDLSR